jgi:hypothetical protein
MKAALSKGLVLTGFDKASASYLLTAGQDQ